MCIFEGVRYNNNKNQLLSSQVSNSRSRQKSRTFSRARITQIDYYSVLGLSKGATQQDIKNAYYRLSKVHHPDKNKGCENSATMFRNATEAYEILGNYRSRKLYDKGIGIISKKTVHDTEVAPIVEEDDAQTKFYKQHMRRSHISVQTTIYDFDQWASKTTTETFQKMQEIKREKKIDSMARTQEEETEHIIWFLSGLFLILAIAYVILVEADSENRINQKNTKNEK